MFLFFTLCPWWPDEPETTLGFSLTMRAHDRKKKKAIDEARKAGTLPPEIDDEGNMVNPHIPEYMSKAPWYLNQSEGAGLKHQRAHDVKHYDGLEKWYKRGVRSKAATKYRAGACSNCGAISHKRADCMERPRKKGARWSGEDIAPDEFSQPKLDLTWDGHRDRWNGYNPDEHQRTVLLHAAAEVKRRRNKVREMDRKAAAREGTRGGAATAAPAGQTGRADAAVAVSDGESDSDSDSDSDADDSGDDDEVDDLRQSESNAVMAQKLHRGGTKVKQTVRNLRIREDTAKYLRNLDPNSAYYDPKTRSMRDNPTPHENPENLAYAGDNFVRHSGESRELGQTQLFAWEAYNMGETQVHLQANPTQAALAQREFRRKKEDLRVARAALIRQKYGNGGGSGSAGAAGAGNGARSGVALGTPTPHVGDSTSVGGKVVLPKELLTGQTLSYVEYQRDGRIIKGEETAAPQSKFMEDARVGNHSSVWGSYFDVRANAWGYACCHGTTRNAYCVGK